MNIIIKKHFVRIECSYILNIVLPLASINCTTIKKYWGLGSSGLDQYLESDMGLPYLAHEREG